MLLHNNGVVLGISEFELYDLIIGIAYEIKIKRVTKADLAWPEPASVSAITCPKIAQVPGEE